jgi:Domain of unknown function (DUF4249)
MHPFSAKQYINLLWVILLMVASCTQEIIIQLPEQPPTLVVISYAQEGRPLTARISVSTSIEIKGKSVIPKDAIVQIYEDGILLERLNIVNPSDSTYWVGVKPIKAGHEYTLKASASNLPSIEASCRIPDTAEGIMLEPDFNDTSHITLPDGQMLLRLPVKITHDHQPDDLDYFAFALTAEVTTYVIDDTGNKTEEVDYTSEFTPQFQTDGDTYAFLHEVPEPMILLHANYWNSNPNTLQFEVLIPYNAQTDMPTALYLDWFAIDPDMYNYLLSVSRQNTNSPFVEPDAISSNINGGVGIFGAYSVNRFVLPLR